MDSNLLFNISLTLNDIRDSISSSGGIKPFIPVISGVAGIVLGFSLNFFKDYLGKWQENKRKLDCIGYEVSDIKVNAFYGITKCMEFYDEYTKRNNVRINIVLPLDAVTICFENFYTDIVTEIPHFQRDSLVKTYKHLSFASDNHKRFIDEMAQNNLSNNVKEKYIISLLRCYVFTVYFADCYINEKPSCEIGFDEYLKTLDVESDGFFEIYK